jgi:hypothetical protein
MRLKHKRHYRQWRIAFLVLLLITLIGPWTFDLIWIPSDHFCDPPYLQLNEDYCGIPLSGIWQFRWGLDIYIESGAGLVTGKLEFGDWVREFLFSLLLLSPSLPLINTLLLILRGDHSFRRALTFIAWISAVAFGLFWGLNNFPRMFWLVWGVWLYTGVAICALILEIRLIFSNHNDHEVGVNAEFELR